MFFFPHFSRTRFLRRGEGKKSRENAPTERKESLKEKVYKLNFPTNFEKKFSFYFYSSESYFVIKCLFNGGWCFLFLMLFQFDFLFFSVRWCRFNVNFPFLSFKSIEHETTSKLIIKGLSLLKYFEKLWELCKRFVTIKWKALILKALLH